jgi:PAS domain S-box-containing protein
MKPASKNHTSRILVVEDEMIVAKDIQQRLMALGYAASKIVQTGQTAVAAVKTRKFDLVLMDIRLQGPMDGIEATKAIQKFSSIPIVYLTAYADQKTLRRAKLTEPFGYILKPVDDTALHTTIEIALYKATMYEQLRQSEKRFREIFENANDVIAFIDMNGVIRDINKNVKDLFGYSPQEILGKQFTQLPLFQGKQLLQVVKRFNNMIAGTSKANLIELEVCTKQGKTVIVEANTAYIKNHDGRDGFLNIIRDITEKKKVDRELVQEQKRSRELTKKIISSQEEERLFLASEIHDELLQGLVAILYFLQKLDLSKLDEPTRARNNQLIEMIKSSIQHGRALISDIEPLRNPQIGFIPAIKNVIRQRYSSLGTKVELKCTSTVPELDQFAKVNIIRIIQEALLNAQKHAESDAIIVKIHIQKNVLNVGVVDDGLGFNTTVYLSPRNAEHHGLLTMQERAKLIGGALTIKSKPNKGTTVKATFPLENIKKT